MNFYITADRVGIPTGGGIVTHHEREALRSLGEEVVTVTLNHSLPAADPFSQDQEILGRVKHLTKGFWVRPTIAHCYAGCLTETVRYLRSIGCKVTYTAAAHSIEVSKREHQKLGIPFLYPHLIQPELWEKYVAGYLEADCLVCPSTYSKRVMESYGAKKVEVIPHGCNLPEKVAPLPEKLVVGYLGAFGPDKGIIYLLDAWKRLNYDDAVLVLAGASSTSPYVTELIEAFGGGTIVQLGWVHDVSEFYNNISLLIQPSASEGFGCEVLEAMSAGRIAICSDGAGAADVALFVVHSCDPTEIAKYIDAFKTNKGNVLEGYSEKSRETAKDYTWDKIEKRYVNFWQNLLKGN